MAMGHALLICVLAIRVCLYVYELTLLCLCSTEIPRDISNRQPLLNYLAADSCLGLLSCSAARSSIVRCQGDLCLNTLSSVG